MRVAHPVQRPPITRGGNVLEHDNVLVSTSRTPNLQPCVSKLPHLPKLKVVERLAHGVLIGLILGGGPVEARDRSVVREFVRESPCPVAGPGTCFQKGYSIDHVIALECGGPDHVSNLAYLNNESHKIKTRFDNLRCKNTWFGRIMRAWRDVQFWK